MHTVAHSPPEGEGEGEGGHSTRGVLPYKRLIGICHWMRSHFHDWSDYNRVAFSIDLLLEWGRKFSHFGVLKVGIQNGKILG